MFFQVAMVVVAAVAMLDRAWVAASHGKLVGLLTPLHVLIAVTLGAGVVGVVVMLWRARRARDVYLVDYGCFLGEPRHRVPFGMALEHGRHMPGFVDDESTKFMVRLYERSAIGEETSVPDSYRYMPPERGVEASREEAELVIFSAVDKASRRSPGVR
jgi:3-ketoacyl-CoA synthase